MPQPLTFSFRPMRRGQTYRQAILRFTRVLDDESRFLSYRHISEGEGERLPTTILAERVRSNYLMLLDYMDQLSRDTEHPGELIQGITDMDSASFFPLLVLVSHYLEQKRRAMSHLPATTLAESIERVLSIVRERVLTEVSPHSGSLLPKLVMPEQSTWIAQETEPLVFPLRVDQETQAMRTLDIVAGTAREEVEGYVLPAGVITIWDRSPEAEISFPVLFPVPEHEMEPVEMTLTGVRLTSEADLAESLRALTRQDYEAVARALIQQMDKVTQEALLQQALSDERLDRVTGDAEIIELLKKAVKGGHNVTVTEALSLMDKGDRETAILRLIEAAKSQEDQIALLDAFAGAINRSAFERPMGGVETPKQAHWREGNEPGPTFDDLWNAYAPGMDKLDLPTSDFDYQKAAANPPAVVDQYGRPFAPAGPTNKADVDVYGALTVTEHPIPMYADVGTTELVVDNYVLMDIMVFLHLTRHQNAWRYAGMTPKQAIQDILGKLYEYIEGTVGRDAAGYINYSDRYWEYRRAFRMVRWYGESAINRHTISTIRRVYEPWQSQEFNGEVGAPHKLENVRIESGVFKGEGSFRAELYVPTYVDGDMKFNARLWAGSTLTVAIDGKDEITLGPGRHIDVTLEMKQGQHSIAFYGSGEVEFSFIRVSGYKFVSYSILQGTQTNINGQGAIAIVLQMLLKYFVDHHTGPKDKGGREHWINAN